tara:strand:- start:785 stop:1264 length:480 start_codon:yes stop_codon:yes gene_type:complete
MSLTNRWTGKGRLGRNPEVVDLGEGRFKVKFSIAVTEYIKGEDKTTWFNIVAFNKVANKVVNRKLGKGDYIEVIGPIRLYEYTTQAGETRREINILLDDFMVLSRSKNSQTPVDAIRKNNETKTETKTAASAWVINKEANSFIKEPWKNYDPNKNDIPF